MQLDVVSLIGIASGIAAIGGAYLSVRSISQKLTARMDIIEHHIQDIKEEATEAKNELASAIKDLARATEKTYEFLVKNESAHDSIGAKIDNLGDRIIDRLKNIQIDVKNGRKNAN